MRQNAENVGRVNEQPGRRRRQNNSAGNAPALTLFIGRPNVAGENLAGRGGPRINLSAAVFDLRK